MTRPVDKSESEWRATLTPEQFRVMRQKGTERPFTGEYWNIWDDGTYHLRVLRRRAVPLR